MVIDTSVVLAFLFLEPDWEQFSEAIQSDSIRLISAASVLEASLVTTARLGPDSLDELDLLLVRLGAQIMPFGTQELALARKALLKYGKGRHPAALNFGDCFSYALAASTGQPLLFKGNDFSQTDIARFRTF